MSGSPRPLKVLQSERDGTGDVRYVDHVTRHAPERVVHIPFTWPRAYRGDYDVFHAHWPEYRVSHRLPPISLARKVLFHGLTLLLERRGTPVVRTLHNLSPHQPATRSERRLLERFDALTTLYVRLNPLTPPPTDLPVVTIPHGHYTEPFDALPHPPALRGRLVFVGQVKPYKGIDRLLDVFGGMADPELSLRIVGRPLAAGIADRIARAEAADARISSSLEDVPDAVMVEEICRSELVVLPYHRMHNSGVLFVALSLERPVLVPSGEVNDIVAAEVGEPWVQRFDGDLTPEAIERALDAVRGDTHPPPPRMDGRDWTTVARLHADAYAAAVADGGSGPRPDPVRTAATATRRRRNRVRAVAAQLSRSTAALRALEAADSLLVRTAGKARLGGGVLVIPPPGQGNVGDSALVQATVQQLGSDTPVLLAGDAASYDLGDGRQELVALPRLVYGQGPAHWRDVRRFGRLAKAVDGLVVIGADIMDGGYNPAASSRRWWCARTATRWCDDVRVISMSWAPDPRRHFADEARRAARQGVDVYVRDPASRHRVAALIGDRAEEAADVVFTLTPPTTVPDPLAPGADRIVVVNASALVAGRQDLESVYTSFVGALVERGDTPVLLPHVMRPGSDDLEVIRRIAAPFDERVVVVHHRPRVAQVHELVGRARYVVTGRMHLGILALTRGTPAIVIATSGKVEGLMELVGLPDCAVAPDALGDRLRALLADPDGWERQARASVAERVPDAQRLAARNLGRGIRDGGAPAAGREG